MKEEALMHSVRVLTSTRQPSGNGRLPVAEDPFGGGKVQPFGQRREHHCDLLRGGFQAIQGGIASGTEGGVAGLTAEGLDPLSRTMLAIPNERMDLSISIAEVEALLVGTGEAFGGYPLRGSSPAFHLAPGEHRSRCWSSTRRGSGGQTTGGAILWGAGLEQTVDQRSSPRCLSMGKLKREPAKTPEPRQKEDEEGHEQKHEHLIGHNDPHCLKSGAARAPVSARISRVERVCQAVGKEGWIIHRREGLYHSHERYSHEEVEEVIEEIKPPFFRQIPQVASTTPLFVRQMTHVASTSYQDV
jgi:hypothetical protein